MSSTNSKAVKVQHALILLKADNERTQSDWTVEVAGLLENHYADKDTLVCNNLHIHTNEFLLGAIM
jgi:hypothetical protein